jgi:hypothetical protein
MNLVVQKLKIKELIQGDTAVSSDDGEIVYNAIVNCIEKKCIVELDFSDITILTTAFLNSAIGQLYNTYKSDQLNTSLKLKNVAEEDRILFKKVIERAKEYFANKKGFEDSANKAIYGG